MCVVRSNWYFVSLTCSPNFTRDTYIMHNAHINRFRQTEGETRDGVKINGMWIWYNSVRCIPCSRIKTSINCKRKWAHSCTKYEAYGNVIKLHRKWKSVRSAIKTIQQHIFFFKKLNSLKIDRQHVEIFVCFLLLVWPVACVLVFCSPISFASISKIICHAFSVWPFG